MQRGTRIVGFQGVMAGVAICAAGYTLRCANLQDFPVIRLIVSIGYGCGQIISFGDALIGVTGFAAQRIGFPLRCLRLLGCGAVRRDPVQTVTIDARRRISTG